MKRKIEPMKADERVGDAVTMMQRMHQRQLRQLTAKMLLIGLTFGAVMFAMGIAIGSYGSLRMIGELVK